MISLPNNSEEVPLSPVRYEWLSLAPPDWETCRVKDLARLQSGNGITSEQIDEDGEYPVFGGNGLRGYFSAYNNEGNHVLIGRQGALCGNINYATEKFWASEHAVVCYLKNKIHYKWFGEMLRVMNLNQYSVAAAQPGLAVERIKRLLLPLPNQNEQKAIACYLDRETGRIDGKLALLEEKALLYKELKQSLINETVTRGLDPSVALRDSGVDWIGEIPEHWEMKRVVDVAEQWKKINVGLRNKNLLSLSYGRIKRRDFNTAHGLLPASFETYQVINAGNIVLRLTDLQNDWKSLRVGLVRESGIITSAYLNLRVFKHCVPTYFYYLLHSFDIAKVFYWQGGGLRQSMKFDDIKILPTIIPPPEEQQAIAKYLDEKTAKIDMITEAIAEQVSLLKELRKTLINDVVTGKIRVTESEGGAA
jgi:type I restriction enzyme S subunit